MIPAEGDAEENPEHGGSGQQPATLNLEAVLNGYAAKSECLSLYTEAYRRYCWPVRGTDDYRIAPFHILATEGKVWNTENHLRHLDVIKKYMTGGDPLFIATGCKDIDLSDPVSRDAGIAWWEELTGSGGEGMVVKPLDFIARHGNDIAQPAVKCRGREYLRIIYGPEYTLDIHLERLKKRSVRKKQRLAVAEFALGMEALERFTAGQPLYRIHECVSAILAMENEEVDPRL
jgi:protein phosphatase